MMEFLTAHFATILFYILAGLTVAGGIGVISFKNPVHSALSLLGTFLMVAALFVLQHAEFLAAVQVLVYAGGILVLFLFVIMLVNIKRMQPEQVFLSRVAPLAVAVGITLGAIIAGLLLAGSLGHPAAAPAALQSVQGQHVGNTEAVGWVLYTKYLVPFEIVSVVLLVAMVGAIIFGRKDPTLEGRGGRMEP
ncbi:MAG: NADH-quinone oxidoreductase subunit J [Acidobacteria bacterium]|jgi:NADH-quinone oxidoreductase subunit J|nr:NADH-quinone oxidoreductase subunit J [Acidobacteriota bacterium]